MCEDFNRVIEQATACLQASGGNAGELLASFTAFVKHVETKFLSRELSSLEETRKHCISSSQSPDCEWVARANDPALVQQLLALLLDALPSLSFNSSAVAVKLDNAEASNPPLALKSEKCEAMSLTDGCKKVLQDLEKRCEHIMQMINELPFADFKGNLPAPHTLLELKQSVDRSEYKSYSEFRKALDHVWTNVQLYYPQHTPAHKAAADMKELGLKLVSETSGLSASQLVADVEAAVVQAPAAPTASIMYPNANFQDMPSLTQMSALGSADLFAQSLFQSMFPTNSFPFADPQASLFSLLLSQQDFNMFNSAPTPGNVPASMGENALNMVHGNHGISMATGGLDPSMINQFFNPISMMFPSLQPAADTAPAPPARAANPAHPKFDISDLPPFPTGTNPLLDPPPELYIHLDMVGITATVHFKCQFNIDALRNYADRNEKKFVPSSDQKKSVENSVNFRISVPGGPLTTQVAGVLFVNGICKVSFARSDLSELFDEIQRHIFTIDSDAQSGGHRVIQDPKVEWVAEGAPSDWRRWGKNLDSINYCLIKKQFQVGFKVMYVAALSLLRPLEATGFIYDLRPAQSSGSGLFFRLRLQPKFDPLDGDISATIYHSGMVQVNGSKGCTEAHLQIACNGICAFLQKNRSMIEPPDEEHADGNKRKKRAIGAPNQ